jgi:hypothetical protein
MKFEDKQHLFKNFLQEWDTIFSKLPHLAKLFASFPSFQQKLEEIPIIKSHELNEYQFEWISLVAQFDNPIEKEFFKPYWVPVSINEYEYFVDLSSKAFTVFKFNYLGSELQQWIIEEVIPDISEFILALDNKTISFDEVLYDNNGNPLDKNGNSIYDDNGNPLDKNGNSSINVSPPSSIDHHELHATFKGYDFASIQDEDVVVYGHFLESPIEERLIGMFNYVPVYDNSTKPYQAHWMISENKLFLFYVNATINGKELTTYDIVPEHIGGEEENPFTYSNNCDDSITFIIDKIENPGYSSSIYNVGDVLMLSFSEGTLTSYRKKA